MVTADALVLGAAATAEAKAFLRVAGADEDPLIERLLGTGAELCEQFTGEALLVRGFSELVPASMAWTRLRRTPVVAIQGVETVPQEGTGSALPATSYAVDIDANGWGWVRLTAAPPTAKVRVRYSAGLAGTWESLPEPLRQGTVRLAAHLYTHRTAGVDASPPAVVTALWRPYRRMRLG